MESATELDQLIAEQTRDADSNTISPEFPWQVPFSNGLANCIGTDADGEIVTNWPRPPKGKVLVGTASWHGTRGGYENHKCRCVPCRGAHASYKRLRRRNGHS